MTEVFSKLIHTGVKLVLATHSNYIFHKFSNLILKGELDPKQVANYHLIHTNVGPIVNPKESIEEDGFSANKFSETTEDLLNERFEAIR